MAQRLFSKTLKLYEGAVDNQALADTLSVVRRYVGRSKFKLLAWNDGYIAVPVRISVEIPPLGTYEGLPVAATEPVLFVFSLAEYPIKAPKVYTDRLDFPKDQMPHLYVAKKGRPPGFCLVKGNMDEWYANKRIDDLFIRVQNWFHDAVTGQLVEDGSQFDPLRLEGYNGNVIYDYDQFADIVHQQRAFIPGSNVALARFSRKSSSNGITFTLDKHITGENLRQVYDEFLKEREKDQEAASTKKYHFGYLIWSNDPATYSKYCVDLPDDWASFKKFCEEYGIDWQSLEKLIAENNFNAYVSFPVIVGIKRPKQLIGFSSNIEFINFYFLVDSPDIAEGKIINNIPVAFQAHNQPLTTKQAKRIAGGNDVLSGSHMVFGVGALGSKILLHFNRSGITQFMVVDPDHLSPHNMVRHALLPRSVGLNKASAMKLTVKEMFPFEDLNMISHNAAVDGLLTDDLFNNFNWLFDFTASEAFFNNIVNARNIREPKVCRASISDNGNLGLLYFEGNNRNPRIDDLQAILYSQYKSLPLINKWLIADKDLTDENKLLVRVGIGCNSETMVLSDEKVSTHAALFAGVIKKESTQMFSEAGKIVLSVIEDEEYYQTSTVNIKVAPMVVMNAVNDPAWEIRIKSGIIEQMKKEMGLAMPHETGGVFIGRANYKTKTIHVTELIIAPPDSMSNPVCFCRGIHGLPEQIAEVNEGTGGQLGYIGEWHTHPFGPDQLSLTDLKTVSRFKRELGMLVNPLPVFLTILTPTHFLPYVY